MIEKVKNSFRKVYFTYPWESMVWIAALVLLALYRPETGTHVSFCVFDRSGIVYCPGCGLGRSIGFLFDGALKASWEAHPAGVFAVGVLVYRIYAQIKEFITTTLITGKHHG